MKIGIATDHRGAEIKKEVIKILEGHGYEIHDYSPVNTPTDDYIDFAVSTCKAYLNHEVDFGILLCRTGIGMSIAANKIKGIRCAKVATKEEAELTRFDNNSNVIALNYNYPLEQLEELIVTFVSSPFSNEERHIRRVEKLAKLENTDVA